MDDTRFQLLLRVRQVAVVHFSCYGLMGHRVAFPADLIHALSTIKHETRSCCAIYPDHVMDLPGSVGVIFRPKYSQVLSVCSIDSGSSEYQGKEGSMGSTPEEAAILESLRVPRGMYNEWRILGAASVGIFVSNPKHILVKQELTLTVALTVGLEQFTEIGCVEISLKAVKDCFPGLPVYTMGADGLEQL